MTIIGYVIAALIALAMLPLLPFFLLYVLADWLTSVGRDSGY